ncbi:Proline-specific permease [Neolecta irregularis DAH-3]|uniref:Proline-specific permease n=1 Tax=Neolecta irregularis (strain DAH-3) TaxID=1198029 RepID=A0A1U7LH68_NEOID|nr:Proline-specific permease [Neolecta irregularis DAH-3]|eukprot:OLL21892.1 Proline-specific permease [Neolecta irregularis DAH-3]
MTQELNPPHYDRNSSSLPIDEKNKKQYARDVIDKAEVEVYGEVQRELKARHVQFIALGGTIGTGLFVGSAKSLANAGPLSALLAYTFMGVLIYFIMQSLGEIVTYLPLPGAVPSLAVRYIDEAWGFAQGWLYWFSFGVTAAAEITAAALVIDFWDTEHKVNVAVYITILYIVIIGLNLLGVEMYGETEFWFASIKIVTIVGLLLLSFIVCLGGNPKHDRIGFRYWRSPGAMHEYLSMGGAGLFLGLWKVLTQAAFSFGGTELIAITAGETRNPRRNVPKAVRRVFWRILVFYVLGILAIGVLVPYNDPEMSKQIKSGGRGASASPFVIGIKRVGIDVVPHIINGVILSSAWSAGNSFVYAGSRTLYSLALDGKAPSFFKKCTRQGVPLWCVVSIAILTLMAYLNLGSSSSQVFDWFSNLIAIGNIVTWCTILVAFLRFKKGMEVQELSRDDLPFKSRWQPYGSYFALFWLVLIIIFNGFDTFQDGFDTSGFFASYISIILFAVLFFGYKAIKRTRFVKPEEMDFFTGKERIDREAAEWREQLPGTWYAKAWDWLV